MVMKYSKIYNIPKVQLKLLQNMLYKIMSKGYKMSNQKKFKRQYLCRLLWFKCVRFVLGQLPTKASIFELSSGGLVLDSRTIAMTTCRPTSMPVFCLSLIFIR